MTAKRIFLPLGIVLLIWGLIQLFSITFGIYDYGYGSAAFFIFWGLAIVFLCRKAIKGYFSDFLLEHRLLLLFTAVHICSLLLLAYYLVLDDWGFVPFYFAEYVLAPGNIIGLVIAALNDYE
ncbi:MAG: hypothetical protein IJR59_06655 [Firmicutes bacterium]|nr:hypothetical protein [Bacillota bacterium]